MFPAESEAIDQIYVDGVVARALNAGASSSPPLLRRATPLAVPLDSSSNFDCSQVRVPSANARMERAIVENNTAVLRANFVPQFKIRVSLARGREHPLCDFPPISR